MNKDHSGTTEPKNNDQSKIILYSINYKKMYSLYNITYINQSRHPKQF